MRVRHRIPSIFNLSMVDVLCCALGCVILLWLINLRQAKDHEDVTSEQMRQTQEDLRQVQQEREGANRQLLTYRVRTDSLEKEKNSLLSQQAALAHKSQELETQLKDAQGRVTNLSTQAADLNRKLEGLTRRAQELQGVADLVPGLREELKKNQQERKATSDKLAASETQLAQQRRSMDDTSKTLEGARSARTALERDLDARNRELAELRPLKERVAAGEQKIAALEKQLSERGRELVMNTQGLDALKEEKRIWQAEAMRARAAVENRFAGIALTGKRVMFLVDMSGSMELVDEKTAAPGKWAEVAATVAKLMRSLPELQHFQVIVFAEKATFLLGEENAWLDFEGQASATKVEQALNLLKPRGGTNMYAAFQTAFRFRPAGMDTIYLLSDGLPNLGEGVAPEVARTLKEFDLSDRLAKYIRRTMINDWNGKASPHPRVKINTIGFFYESPDVGSFLWALARENEGSFVGMSKP